ncbi:MAG: DUF218 domain-containing protein [Clostridiales bacterium]|nr:DUF218 domain-containing protein [Clostridiales bacterium]
MKKNRSRFKRKYHIVILAVIIILLLVPFIINGYVINYSKDYIIERDEAEQIEADCILVLGAGLKTDGTPNYMLRDRLDTGIDLYLKGSAPKLLLSGDNGHKGYDEVNAMKRYVLDSSISSDDIFMDHAGFSTYESMYRARTVFDVQKVIIVTQEYHLYRSLYIARKLGLDAYGVEAKPYTYVGQSMREFREILARNKDFFKTIFKPKPSLLGDVIPISGDGILSHD